METIIFRALCAITALAILAALPFRLLAILAIVIWETIVYKSNLKKFLSPPNRVEKK